MTYENAEERESRLPLIEAVVVLENERKCLPELAARPFSPLHEQARVPLTPKKR